MLPNHGHLQPPVLIRRAEIKKVKDLLEEPFSVFFNILVLVNPVAPELPEFSFMEGDGGLCLNRHAVPPALRSSSIRIDVNDTLHNHTYGELSHSGRFTAEQIQVEPLDPRLAPVNAKIGHLHLLALVGGEVDHLLILTLVQ